MQANDLLEYRNKIIDAFKNATFSSEYLKKNQMTLDIIMSQKIEENLPKKLNPQKKN